jgi:Outer membrane receptor for ferrienterochelin and colicins
MTHRGKLRLGFLSATVLTGTALASPAAAQDDAGTPVSSVTTFGDEILVTGTRRATTIQDAPINITAIGGEELARQRIDDVRDLADFTPGLTISDTGPARQDPSCCAASAPRM